MTRHESPTRPNRGVTVRCRICGIEITGSLDDDGMMVRPSDRARPAFGAPVRDGLCMTHATAEPACGWDCFEVGAHASHRGSAS